MHRLLGVPNFILNHSMPRLHPGIPHINFLASWWLALSEASIRYVLTLSCVPWSINKESITTYLSCVLSLQEWMVCGKTRLSVSPRPDKKVWSMLAVSQVSSLIFALLLAYFQHITLVSYLMAPWPILYWIVVRECTPLPYLHNRAEYLSTVLVRLTV